MNEPARAANASDTDRAEASAGAHALGAGGAWCDRTPHPVRRWIARQFDTYVTTGVLFLALALPWAMLALRSQYFVIPIGFLAVVYLLGPLRGVATAALNALLLSRTSTTPGKWLCGVRVVRKDGARMTFKLAFGRELGALAAGCAIYVPVVPLFTMGSSFFQLRKNGAASWDVQRDLIAVQRPDSGGQAARTLLAVVLLGIVLVLIAALTTMGGAH